MKNFHVTHKNGSWRVIGEGNTKASFITNTKKEALSIGIELARKNHSELVIHGLNGRIQDKDSYGNDPLPPKDRMF